MINWLPMTPLRNQPWNMLFCFGGFLDVPDLDFGRLRGMIDAST